VSKPPMRSRLPRDEDTGDSDLAGEPGRGGPPGLGGPSRFRQSELTLPSPTAGRSSHDPNGAVRLWSIANHC
jgi:hypothetical protein